MRGVAVSQRLAALLVALAALVSACGSDGVRDATSGRETHPSSTGAPAEEILFSRAAAEGSRSSLYVVRADGGAERLLAGDAAEPAVSPDAQRIAFVRNGAVWIMQRDGTRQRQVTKPVGGSKDDWKERDGSPAWSRDGTRMIFTRASRENGTEAILSVDLSSTDVRRLTRPAPVDNWHCHSAPAPSPDGRLVLFAESWDCSHGNDTDLSAITSTGRPTPVPFEVWPNVEAMTIHFAPSWAPDGRRIAFSALDLEAVSEPPWGRVGASGLYVSRQGTAAPKRIVTGRVDHPAWSRDGRWIAFVRERVEPDGYPGDIWILRDDGTTPRPLVRTRADERDPVWLAPTSAAGG